MSLNKNKTYENPFGELIGVKGYINEEDVFVYVEQEKLAWWYGASQINNWFVKNVQEDSRGNYIVVKEDLEKLYGVVTKILGVEDSQERKRVAKRYLPEGKHERSEEYDSFYFGTLENTKSVLDRVLGKVDFENIKIFYLRSC